MKTSKLILITFVGLLFSILTVTIDLNNRGQLTSIKELPTAAKSCLKKYFPDQVASLGKIKKEIVKTTYEMGKENVNENMFCSDNLLTCYNY